MFEFSEYSVEEMINGSPALKAGTSLYSKTFALTRGGVLNIYDNLTESDCKNILKAERFVQIQFARAFGVSAQTFELINNHFLVLEKTPDLRFDLNGFGAITNLDCLKYLSNLKSLSVDMYKNNQLDEVNKHLRLRKLSLGGNNISISSITEQTELEELFLFEKLKDIEVIGTMPKLRKVSFSKMTLKNLVFLLGLSDLQELNFILGSATDYSKLPEIGRIEKLSFTLVRKLTHEHLLPINNMQFLKELELDSLAHLTDLNWLTNKSIKTDVIGCKNYRP